MSSTFDVVVAADSSRGIGKQGVMPWHLPQDMKRFKELTSGSPEEKNAVIMGRRTWESIPDKYRPLVDRLNIVITRSADYKVPEGVKRCNTLDEALAIAQKAGVKKSFVMGGGQIYEMAINHPACRTLYLTEIKSEFQCDTFFPEYKKLFSMVSESEMFSDGGIEYSFKIFKRL